MIGGKHHPPGVFRHQEKLKADGPLQGVGINMLLVFERNNPAPALAFSIAVDPFPLFHVAQHPGQRRICRHANGFSEHDLTDIGTDIGVLIDKIRDFLGL